MSSSTQSTSKTKSGAKATDKPLNFKARAKIQPKEAPINPWRLNSTRQIPLILGSIAGASIPLYLIFVYRGYKKEAARVGDNVPLDVRDRYYSYNYAEKFDAEVNTMEWLGGITKKREQLVSKAQGHVLEIAVGTGRNFEYLPLLKGVKSVTMVDQSPDMLRIGRLMWAEKNSWYIRALFYCQDGAKPVPFPKASPEGFDTVIQTMGICSTPEPEKVLSNMGMMAKEETGRILLLEHGRGYYNWLNNFLDTIAPAHANRHGCWFNKDIGEIVRRSGLEILEEKRSNFGTVWWYVLKPPKGFREQEAAKKDEQAEAGSTKKPWWAWSSWK